MIWYVKEIDIHIDMVNIILMYKYLTLQNEKFSCFIPAFIGHQNQFLCIRTFMTIGLNNVFYTLVH